MKLIKKTKNILQSFICVIVCISFIFTCGCTANAKYCCIISCDNYTFIPYKGATPMHIAAIEGRFDIMQKLKDQGIDINIKDEQLMTPMHLSARDNGHIEVMKWLKNQSADINVKNINGDTPLMLAAWDGNLEAVKFLAEQGADVNAKDDYGNTPMQLAINSGHTKVAEWLKANGAIE